jgi:ribosomal protein S6--L-glutamate ligase
VVAAMQRDASPGEFRANLHRGGSASVATLSAEERRIAVQAAAALGLGVAGVDMLRSKRGPLILEVNASPGLEGIEAATGVDVAGSIIQLLETEANSVAPSQARRRVRRVD